MMVIRDREVTPRELWTFFVITLGFSAILVLASGPMVEPGVGLAAATEWYVSKATYIIGLPIAVALMCAFGFRGRSGGVALLKRVALWRVGWKWWLIAILLPVATQLAVALATGRHGFLEPGVGAVVAAWLGSFAFLFVLIICEELGWRGYALPALQARMTPFTASILLGIAWGAWHYPVYWGIWLGTEGSTDGVWLYLLAGMAETVGISLVLTWLANNTKASVLIAMAYHAANNASLSWNMPADGGAWGLIASWPAAPLLGVAVVLLNRRMFFSTQQP